MWNNPALTVFVILALATISGCCIYSSPGYKGPRSDHFDGTRFYNQGNSAQQGFFSFLKWITTRDAPEWREVAVTVAHQAMLQRAAAGDLRVTFINHATFLIQMDGMNILTDPIWSERTSPVSFSGPRRVQQPGVLFDDLPPIDAVLVSHNHYDHMDLPTLKKIAARDNPRIYTGMGNRAFLEKAGIGAVEDMDWWQQEKQGDALAVTFVPAKHFSSRGMCDHNKTLWGGFVIASPAGAVYFAGDTGFGPHFEQIAQRFPNLRLALLPIGAFQPKWFMAPHHLSPQDALRAHFVLKSRTSIAMHYGTFRLGDDKQNEPVETLQAAIAAAAMGDTRFWIMRFGETMAVPPL